MKRILFAAVAASTILASARAEDSADSGFVSIFDGKTFNGWKPAVENSNTFRIEDGAFVTRGPRCHLYYVGADKPFKNFELKVDVMTETNANGGIYFHTKYQPEGWPKYGFESQVNTTHADPQKTGGLYDVVKVNPAPSQDNKWWTQDIIVKGNHITVKIDGKTVVDYTEPAGKQPGSDFTRKIDEGTFALQAHDPKSVVRYKNIRVKRLD
jgi:hypothetical protein